MRATCVLALPLLLVAAAPPPSFAAWPAGGDTLYSGSHPYGPMTLALDGAGGVLAWWGNYAGGAAPILRAARVSGSGAVHPNWDEANPSSGALADVDGLGGIFKVWSYTQFPNGYVYANHIVAAGGLDPAWPSQVLVISTSANLTQPPTVTNDGAGGAFVTFGLLNDVYVRRVLANGGLAGGWPTGGRQVTDPLTQPSSGIPNLIRPDGSGGAYVAWPATLAQVVRVTSAGGFATGWSAGGLSLGGDGAGINLEMVDMFPSGTGGFIVCWTDQNSGLQRAWLQRFLSTGALDPAWPADGFLATSNGDPGSPLVCSDGIGGAIVAWLEAGVPRGLRVLQSGAIASGWTSAGHTLLDAGAQLTTTFSPALALATGGSGGVIVCWSDARRPGRTLVRARWLLGDATPDPAVADSGLVASSQGSNGFVLGATRDGAGGAYVGWQLATGFGDLAMLNRVEPSGVTAVAGAPRVAVAALAAWPNPARDALSLRLALADDSPARLELLDLAGRRARARDVAGAGEHLERFDGLGGLAPGIYLVRLAQGARIRTTRVAILR